MARIFDMMLTNAMIVNHDGTGQRDIGIRAGRIAEIGDLSQSSAGETIDCKGLHIVPGIIDSQVHFREPGLTHKEDLTTGSLSAVLGGVTTIFEMPNTNPATISELSLADKLKRAHHTMYCDFAFWVGATSATVEDIADLERLPGAAGIKVFAGSSTGNLLVDDEESLEKILKYASRRVAFHSEDEQRLKERKNWQMSGNVASHSVWRDEEVALGSTKRLVRLARKTKARIHILHVSTAEEMNFLQDHKDLVTIEVTPHHLTLSLEDYARLGTLAQMNPPIRSVAHRDALWHGIKNGMVDIIGSDHAPHSLEEKQRIYPESPSGMTGVQTLVPIMLDHVNAGHLSLERFVDLTSQGPNRIFSISRKGRIAVGYDADLTIIDLKRQQRITNAMIASKAGWTPYDGKIVTGWPIGTIIRGSLIMWEGEIVHPPIGEAVQFQDAKRA